MKDKIIIVALLVSVGVTSNQVNNASESDEAERGNNQ